MDKTNEIKVKNMSNISYTVWIIGYLFTCGISNPDGIEIILLFVAWPVFLGELVAKLLGLS